MDTPENTDNNVSSNELNIANLPQELLRYVSVGKLQANSANYPEMQADLSPEQVRRVSLIKDQLLQLPLIHTTRKPLPSGASILPISELSEVYNPNTQGLDKSLGLDKYTFFHWGLPIRSSYGRNFLLISPSILLDPNTIASPYDIGIVATADDTPFDEIPDARKARYQEHYFDKMVTGVSWLEINARRVLHSYENGNPFFELASNQTLGEIKHFGAVDPQLIAKQITAEDFPEYYKFLYEHGFAWDRMESARSRFLRTGKKDVTIDPPTPEEFGVNYEKCSKYWKELLA